MAVFYFSYTVLGKTFYLYIQFTSQISKGQTICKFTIDERVYQRFIIIRVYSFEY